MDIKNYLGQIEKLENVGKRFSPFIDSKSPYLFLAITSFLLLCGSIQLIYLTSPTSEQVTEHFSSILIGIVLFLTLQHNKSDYFLNKITNKPVLWLLLAIFVTASSLFSVSISGATRTVFLLNLKTAPVVSFCIVMFYSSVGRYLVKLNKRQKLGYLTLFVVLVFLTTLQPNMMQIKSIFLISFFYFALAGMRRQSFELLCLMVILLLVAIFLLEPYRTIRLFGYLNYHEDPYGHGYQTYKSLTVWANSDLFRFGLQDNIKIRVPDMVNALPFTATAQLWGKLGTLVIIILISFKFILVGNGIEKYKNEKIALIAFGMFVIYFQSVIGSFLSTIGLFPPSHQIVGVGFFTLGGGTVFVCFACALGCKILCNQQPSTVRIIILYERKPPPVLLGIEYFKKVVIFITLFSCMTSIGIGFSKISL